MKLSQSEELDSQRSVKHIEEENPEVLIDCPEYKADSDGLEASLIKTDTAIIAQVTEGSESAGTVDLKKKDAANAVLDVLTRGKSIAKKDKNLLKLLTFSFSFFYYTTKERSIQRMLGAIKVMTDRSELFPTILPKDYKVATDLIDTFKTAKELPKIGKEAQKTDGTDALSVSLAEGKVFKLSMVSQLVRKYRISNPPLAEKAELRGHTAKKMSHNIGKYMVVDEDTMEELESPAITQNHTTEKGKKSTIVFNPIKKEIQTFKTHGLGDYLISVSVTGYIDSLDNKVTFKKNDPNEFTFRMKRIPATT